MEIYHNPRCSKSRQTLQLLEEKGIQPKIKLYLETPPTKEELLAVIKKLGISAEALLRKNEAEFKENYNEKELTEEVCIAAMLKYPKLIERPIVIVNDSAVIGRPPEQVLTLI